ncbi:MAG: multicopper oxidase domain-containing protein [Thaumarchaeota archaeon]|nr:multicopper oxidase domain-containing protein [Nitrososphaerota archaeon]
MASRYAWIGISAAVFVAGIGIGYAIFVNTYSPYVMMGQPQFFNQAMQRNPQFAGQYMGYLMQRPGLMNQYFSQNPQYAGQWTGYMIQNPQLRQQMYDSMLQNRTFMYGMMGSPYFQNQYMGPWMMQNPQFERQWAGPATPGGQSGRQSQGQFNGTTTPQSAVRPGYPSGPVMRYGGYGYGQGMMNGGYGPGTGYGQGIRTISIPDAEAASALPGYAQASKQNNTITYASQTVDLVALSFMGDDAKNFTGASPPPYAKDDVFVVGNMIDPTLVLKAGTTLNVTSINLDDDMSHNFAIMTGGPPYPYMAMQSMMYGGVVATMPVLPNDNAHAGYAYEFTYQVTLSQPGTYWYVCTYPGHAQDGMYGKILVQ